MQLHSILFFSSMTKQAAMRGRMILWQGTAHARAMTGGALFFRLLFWLTEKTLMITILGQGRRSHWWGLPQKQKNAATDQGKEQINQPGGYFFTLLFRHYMHNPKCGKNQPVDEVTISRW